MPKGKDNRIVVVPNDEQSYFMRVLNVPTKPGLGNAALDIALRRGLWIVGRVTDRATGKPVLAHLHYLPFRNNSHVPRDAGFDRDGNTDGDQHRYRTRADGSYRIPGLPGHAIVGAEAIESTYRKGFGASEIKGRNKDGRFDTYHNPLPANTKWPDSLREINPAEGTETVNCDLTLDAGESVRVNLVDAEKKPVSGCVIQGRRPSTWDVDVPGAV